MAGQSYSNKMPLVFLEIDITNKSLYGKKKSSVVAFCMSGGDVRRGPAAWCWAGRGT